MMRAQYFVLVVAPDGELTNNPTLSQMTGARFDHVTTVHDLYGYFTSGKRPVDLVLFDIHTLCGQNCTQGFEITNMIQVLARITPQKTPPTMAVLVDQKQPLIATCTAAHKLVVSADHSPQTLTYTLGAGCHEEESDVHRANDVQKVDFGSELEAVLDRDDCARVSCGFWADTTQADWQLWWSQPCQQAQSSQSQ